MILHLIKPSAQLTPYIKTYWYLKNDSLEKVSQTIVPNGLMGLCFYRSGALDYKGLAHILCKPWLDATFGLYGIDGLMNQIASHGCYWMFERGQYLITDLSSVAISEGIGLLYLLGVSIKLKIELL